MFDFTSGAAIAISHHTMPPKVWAVANKKSLLSDLRRYDNTILMSETEGHGNQGSITGLNGLLIGAAKRHTAKADLQIVRRGRAREFLILVQLQAQQF